MTISSGPNPDRQQDTLFEVPFVTLAAGGKPIVPPPGLIYSTDPHTWFDSDGHEYVVKGPALEVVVAEATAHSLAKKLDLPVPPFALGRLPSTAGIFFASEMQAAAMRDVEPWLRSHTAAILDDLAQIVLFYIWIANADRNIGNLLAVRETGSSSNPVKFIAIDFEKALTLRSRFPLVESNNVEPRRCWPQGVLGRYLTGTRFPHTFLAALKALDDTSITAAIEHIRVMIGDSYTWWDATAAALLRRRDRLSDLAREAWQ